MAAKRNLRNRGMHCIMAIRVAVAAIGCLLASAHLFAQSDSQNPLDPKGFPIGKGRDERLPPPLPPDAASYEFKILSADESNFSEKTVEGKKIKFEYRGYRGECDDLLGDLETNEFVLKGNVNLLGQGSVTKGESVYINFESRTFRAMDATIDIKKTLTQGRTLSDIYLRSALTQGSEERMDAQGASVTTCILDDPHFKLESDSLTFIPNKKIVFRNFRLRVLDKTLFAIPSVTIPLTRNRSNYLPDVGQSEDEGFYVKLKYGVPVGEDTASLLARFRSKLGYSLGAEYESERGSRRTFMRTIADFDPAQNHISMTGAIEHTQKFSFGRLRLNHSSRQFSYLSGPSTVSHSSLIEFAPILGKGGNTNLTYLRNEVLSSGFRSMQSALSFADARQWAEKLRTTVRLTYSDNEASQGGSKLSNQQALDVRFTSIWDEMHYSAQLDYNRAVPIGSTENFASGVDRTPELSLRTDSQKLFTNRLPFNFQAAAFLGSYQDHFNNSDITRMALDLRATSQGKQNRPLTLDYDLGFRQGVYSDDTAQYTPKANLRLGYKLGERFSANIRYNYTKMFGFTPLAVDRSGEYNLTTFDMLAEPLPKLKFGGQVGFDFRRQDQGRIAWTSPSIRMEYEPRNDFRFRANIIYDSENKEWASARLDFRWKPGATTLAATALYDARRNSWGNINFYLDALKAGRLSVSVLGAYNGYLKRFDSLHLSFIYDLHCNEAVLQIIDNRTGFRPGTEILFFIRIKALPFATPFGIGRQGQSMGGGGGGVG